MSSSKRQPSSKAEFIVILFIAFGWSVFGSLSTLASIQRAVVFSDAALITTAVIEVFALGIIVLVLRNSSWKPNDFGVRFSIRDIATGALLALAAIVANAISFVVLSMLSASEFSITSSDLSVLGIAAIVLINPFYEEFLVVGYVFAALERMGCTTTTAINFSVGLRLLYHLYQGPVGVIAIIPIGLLMAFVYARWRRLWPLVIGHALLDIYGLASIL